MIIRVEYSRGYAQEDHVVICDGPDSAFDLVSMIIDNNAMVEILNKLHPVGVGYKREGVEALEPGEFVALKHIEIKEPTLLDGGRIGLAWVDGFRRNGHFVKKFKAAREYTHDPESLQCEVFGPATEALLEIEDEMINHVISAKHSDEYTAGATECLDIVKKRLRKNISEEKAA